MRLRKISRIFAAVQARLWRRKTRAALGNTGLKRKLYMAWAALLFERFWRRFAPLLLIVLLFAACCWLNLFNILPFFLHALLLLLFAAAFIAALLFLCALRLPAKTEALVRLEHDSGFHFSQLGLEKEKPAPPVSAAAAALWREHKRRMRRDLPALRLRLPRPNLPAYDPYGLRAAVFLLFVIGFAYSLSGRGGRLSDAFYFGAPINLNALRADAWINPPEWTGRPPIYLNAGDNVAAGGENSDEAAFSAPAQSVLTARINEGGRRISSLRCAAAGGALLPVRRQQTDAGSVYTLSLAQSAQCRFSSPLGVRIWNIAAEADKAPQISWRAQPQRALNGVLKLDYAVYDDYGVKKAWAEITPLADSAAAPLYFARLSAAMPGAKQVIKRPGGSLTLWQGADISKPVAGAEQSGAIAGDNNIPAAAPLIPLPQINLALPSFRQSAAAGETEDAARRGGAAQTEVNLSKNAWAGAYVSVRLAAEDEAGHIGYSAAKRLVLPQQNFVSPLSRSLSEQRRLLAASSANAPRALMMLNALLLRPEAVIPDKGAALALYSLRARLSQTPQVKTLAELKEAAADSGFSFSAEQLAAAQRAQIAGRDAQLRDIAAYMAAIAEGLDGGKLAAAEKRLKQAAQALREALRNGAGEEEIARLMQNLRSAMDDYITMLAERGQNPGEGGETQMLGESDLEKRLKALEEAAKQGQRGTAEQMLSDFEALMKDLQVGQGGGGDAHAGGKSAAQSQMQKQMDALSDIMRRQQQLLDDTHKNKEEALRGGEGESSGKPPQQESQQGQSLEQRQNELQKDLQDLRGQMQSRNIGPKGGFGAAQNQMDASREALQRGDMSGAQAAQTEALQSLRDDAQNVMGQMREALAKEDAARQGKNGAPGGANGQGQNADTGGQDPLGRPAGTGQAGNQESLPEGEALSRARRILEEIRKKLGVLTPKQEKEYLERLLNFE